MPEFTGVSHVGLSVHDREASAKWYRDVLGFEEMMRLSGEGFETTVVLHRSGFFLGLAQHERNEGESFQPHRTGMDHLSFAVTSRAELDAWVDWFAQCGVTYSPVVDGEPFSVLSFKDPDNIALELFYMRTS